MGLERTKMSNVWDSNIYPCYLVDLWLLIKYCILKWILINYNSKCIVTVVLGHLKKYWLELAKKVEQCTESIRSENAKHINVETQCLCSEVSLRAPYRKPRDWNLKSIMSFVRIIYNWPPFEKECPRVDQRTLIEPLITALNTMIVLVIWFYSFSDLGIEVISDWSVLSWPEA